MTLIISVVLTTILACFVYNGQFWKKIVISILVVAIWMLMEFITGYIILLVNIDFQISKNIGSVFSKVLTLLFVALINRFFQNENIKELPFKYNILFMFVPIGSMFIIYNIFHHHISTDYNKTYYLKESLIGAIVMLIINIVMYNLYMKLSEEMELRKYNAVYAQQLDICARHTEEKELLMTDFRNARHDLKQHFIVLSNMLEHNKTKEAILYLDALAENNSMDKLGISRTDNIIVDALINAKYNIALRNNIAMSVKLYIPMQLPFESADISIVLGNLLDNAIEAVCKCNDCNKYIKLYIKFEKNVLIITEINPFVGKLCYRKNGGLISGKDDRINHGFGLRSIKQVAEKYHGTLVTEVEDRLFKLKIILCAL